MKKLHFLIVFAMLLSGCYAVPTISYMHPDFNTDKFKKVAVVDFRDAPQHPGSGGLVADIFETTLITKGKFILIERSQIAKVLSERNLSTKDFVDWTNIGKLIHADLIITGSVTAWQTGTFGGNTSTVGASVKAIDVNSGIIMWSIDKSVGTTYYTDGLSYNAPPELVAKKLVRGMVDDFIKK